MQATMFRTSTVSRLSATRPSHGPLLPARPHRAMFVRATASGGKQDPGYYPLTGKVDPTKSIVDDGYYPLQNVGVGAPGTPSSSSSSSFSSTTIASTNLSNERSIPVKPVVQVETVSTTGGGNGGGKGPSNFGKGSGGGGGGSEPAAGGGGKQLWDTLKLIVGITAVLWGLNFLFNKLTKPPAGDKAWVGKAATAEHRAQAVRAGAQDVKEKAKKVEKEAESLAERGAGAVKHGAEAVKDKAGELLHRGEHKAKEEAHVASSATRGMLDGVKDTFNNVAHKVSGTAESAGANVKGGVQAAANNIKGGLNAAGDKVKGLGGSQKSSGFPTKTLATVGTIAGATVGAAAVIGGTALYFIDKSRKAGPSTKSVKTNRSSAVSTGTTATSTPANTATKTKTVEVKTTAQIPKTGDTTPADQVKATVVSK